MTCDDVAAIETAVIADNPSGSIDPIFHGVLLTYAQEHADTFGGLWLDREANGTVVLAFTDDPLTHRDALAARRPSPDDEHAMDPMPPITDDRPIGEWGVAFDVVQVTFTEADLNGHIGAIVDALGTAGVQDFGVGASLTRNRIAIWPPDAPTADEVAAMAAAIEPVAPLDMVCVDATVVEQRPDPIAPGTPLDVVVLPDTDGAYPPDTAVECGSVAFTLGDLQSMTPIEEADPGLRSVVTDWANSDVSGGQWPADGWAVLTETDERATVVRIDEVGMMTIGAEMGRNGWIWASAAGGSPCDVSRRLPDGMGTVDWVLDPVFPAPDPTATELHVLATEQACTGGSEIGDRLLGPQVVETADAVRIVFAAIPLTGEQACPGNPAAPVTITLDQPLGDRTLIDGLYVGRLHDLVP